MRSVRVLSFALVLSALAASANAQVVNISTNVSSNTTWGPTGTVVGTTFRIVNNIAINAGVTLTIQPGVVVKFNAGTQLAVNGALQAVGTAPANIYFTSIKDDNNPAGDTNADGNATTPANADWNSIVFADGTTDGSSALTYCDIRYAGSSNYGALRFTSSSHAVTNCVIRKSTYGIDCVGTSSPTLTNTSIEASTSTPVVIDFTANPSFSSLAFSSANNGYDAIGLRGGTLSGAASIPKRGATVGANPISNVTYVLLSSLTIESGGALTIAPGVVIKPVAAYSFIVNSGGDLTMNGTAAAGDTITITSIHDDNFGAPNDTNNNGSISAPNRGDWGQVVFAQGATGSLQRCRLKFGTTSATGGLVQMTNNSIGISNTLLSDAGHGLTLYGTSSPAISDVAIQNCSSTPILMSVASTPVLTNLTFLANSITAIGLHGEDVGVNSTIPQRNTGGFANITYYLMNGALHVLNGATLTIAPGVVIKNQPGSGGIVCDGALVADGTPGAQIVFTSLYDDLYGNPADTNGDGSTTTPSSGNWQYIRFTGTSNDATCILDNCRLAYGGYYTGDSWPTIVWATSASPRITNSFLFKSPYGIRVDGDSAPIIDGNTFDNLTYAPIAMSVLSDPQLSTNNTYTTNGYNALALISETLSQNGRIRYRPNVGNPASPTFAYLPTGTITVASGVTLTVDPQVVLKPTSSFVLFTVNGALNLVGSNATTGRIFFTSRRDDAIAGDTTPTDSSTPQAGDWGYIEYNDTAVDAACIVRNVLFQFGGPGQTSGVLTTNSAGPRFARLEFFQNRTAFTFTGTSQPTLDSLNILNCTNLPIVSSLISEPGYGTQITFANNSYLALGILSETIAQNVRTRVGRIGPYSNLNYAPVGTITIAFGATWTIDPGVVMKFGRIFSDPVGTSVNVSGAIAAVGKPDSLIIFTSLADDAFGQDVMNDGAATTPQPGHWQGFQLEPVSNDVLTSFQHCRFRYGSYSTGVLRFESAGPTISNCVFTRSNYAPVYIVGASTPTFNDCDFDSTTAVGSGVPVFLSIVSDPVFNNCRFLGNWYTALGVVNESIAQDVLWKIRPVAGRLNMPYFMNSTLTIGLGATLTIQPGVQVKGYGGASIAVQRALLAEGRTDPESLIVFTSYRDDFYGGDSNNDGSLTAPAPSDWGYISIEGTAIDPQVRFRNCVFRYGGSGTTQGAIRCVNSSPTIDSTLFAYNHVGVSVEGSSNPAIHGCSIYGNTYFGINNTGAAFCVNADGNWWGAATGPNDASATADLCGLGVNAGTGDIVSNNVDYLPFATSGIQNPLLGDVSLNGQVLAYDASLVMQYTVSLIALSPLQLLVADVSGVAGVSAFDASLILQYVAGVIKAFPAASTRAGRAVDPVAAELMSRAQGRFEVALGDARREGDEWLVPVVVTGDAPVWAVELKFEGGSAAALAGATPADGERVVKATGAAEGRSAAAFAALEPLSPGAVAVLRYTAGPDEFEAPRLVFARVNEVVVPLATQIEPPQLSFLGRPSPNPVRDAATLRFDVAPADAGAPASVRVIDVTGRAVRVLHDAPLAAGRHSLTWDLAGGDGRAVPAGVYFVRADVRGSVFTQRLVVVR